MKNRTRQQPRRLALAAQRGVSLIEVLVAMLVVSFGVLAVAGLLANASRYGKTSEYRAVATLLANDIVDRIRANKPAVNPPAGAAAAYNMTDSYDTWADKPGDFRGCANKDDCAPAEIAQQDRAEWGQAVFSSLPGGAAYVELSPNPLLNPTADVWIAWLDPEASRDEAKAGSNGNECPPAFQNADPQPRCAYFRVGL